jgi:RHS repeat-associated protein
MSCLVVAAACSQPAVTSRSQAATNQIVTFMHAGFSAGPAVFTDSTGHVIEERRYEPFGVPVDAWIQNASGFTIGPPDFVARDLNWLNKRTEVSTGWSDHGARWMAPESGRWLSPDALVMGPQPRFMLEPWGLNPYQYGQQNPTAYWDPDGNDPERIHRIWIVNAGHFVGPDNERTEQFTRNFIHGLFSSGGDGAKYVNDVTAGHVAARVSATSPTSGDFHALRGTVFMLVDLRNDESVRVARAFSPRGANELLNNEQAFAASPIAGGKVLISIDRLQSQFLDKYNVPLDERGSAERFLRAITFHEYGHAVGLCHESPCGGPARVDGDLMHAYVNPRQYAGGEGPQSLEPSDATVTARFINVRSAPIENNDQH